MILMAMGQHNCLHPVGARGQVGDIGVHQIDAEHVAFGEHKPGVDHHNVAAIFERQHVFADLAEATQGNNAKRCLCQK